MEKFKFRLVIVTPEKVIEDENRIVEVDSICRGITILYDVAKALYPFRKDVYAPDTHNEVYLFFKSVDTGFMVPFVPNSEAKWYVNMFICEYFKNKK